MRTLLATLLLLTALPLAHAQDALPAWERLTLAQREELIAPLRERWNAAPPAQRQRMLQHARRWAQMTPEQRQRAQHGMQRWKRMSPEERQAARAAFERARALPPEQRKALMQRLRQMTPEQRQQWLRDNAAPKAAPAP